MTLFINCCVRKNSRSLRLAKAVLAHLGDEYEEIRVEELGLTPLNEEAIDRRTRLVEEGHLDDPSLALAKQFASAETIVIAAPYWDLGFPALLKLYLEQVYVIGIVSSYDETGRPHGLCQGKNLYFVTTSGGPYSPDYGYHYVREIATKYWGVKRTHLVFLDYLDIVGVDAEAKLIDAISALKIE